MGGRVEETMGYPPEELIGQSLFDHIAPAARTRTEQAILGGLIFAYETVLLPASDEREAKLATRDSQTAAPCEVLVVDDEQLVRAHLRRALELRGYRVDEAGSGKAGLARFAASPPVVIVLEFMMGDMTGIDVIRCIRETGSHVPIVLSSGYLDASAEQALGLDSFQAFLRKPYRTEDLMQTIEQARALGSPNAHAPAHVSSNAR